VAGYCPWMPLSLRWMPMTDNTTNKGGPDAGSGSGSSPSTLRTNKPIFRKISLRSRTMTTNWTSGVAVSHGQYSAEMNAPSSGLTVQQELNMYANGWHAQGWWALVFAEDPAQPQHPGLGEGRSDQRWVCSEDSAGHTGIRVQVPYRTPTVCACCDATSPAADAVDARLTPIRSPPRFWRRRHSACPRTGGWGYLRA
jgi:hypothetical protein